MTNSASSIEMSGYMYGYVAILIRVLSPRRLPGAVQFLIVLLGQFVRVVRLPNEEYQVYE